MIRSDHNAAARQPSARPALFEPLEQRRYLSVSAPAADAPDAPGVPLAAAAVDAGPAAGEQVARPLKVYSWHDRGIDGVTPMVWVRMHAGTPQEMAAETIPTLLEREPGDRALLLWQLGGEFLDRGLDDIIRNGFQTEPDRQWLTTYFGLLKDAGITPDFIVMDYEDGVSTWGDAGHEVARVMNDPSLLRLMPEDVRQFTAADFKNSNWREANTAWNRWATGRMVDALREAVRTPARETFGHEIAMSNWEDHRPTTEVYDANGWAINDQTAGSVAGWSSPALYLEGRGQRLERYDDSNWANFTSNLNTIRSVLGSGEKVAPWISDAAYGNDPQLWAEQLRHIRASGVDTLLLWNPGEFNLNPAQFEQAQQTTRDTFAEVFAMKDAPHEAARRLPQLDLDAREVETLGYGFNRVTRQGFVSEGVNLRLDPALKIEVATADREADKADKAETVAVAVKRLTDRSDAKILTERPTIMVLKPAVDAAPAQDAAAEQAPAAEREDWEVVYRPARGELRVRFLAPADLNLKLDFHAKAHDLFEQAQARLPSLTAAAASDDLLR